MTYLKIIAIRFIGLISIYTFLRVLFILLNTPIFNNISSQEYITIFSQGLRFDITILLYLNFFFLTLHFLPTKLILNKTINKILLAIFISTNSIGIIISLSDIAFYKFNSKRIDSEVLGLTGSLPTMFTSFLLEYWYLFIVFFVLIFILFKLYKYTNNFSLNLKSKIYIKISTFIIFVGISIIGLRGGIQNKPIKPVTASGSIKIELAPLITNSPFTFAFSLFNRNLKTKTYFSESELIQLFPLKKSINSSLKIDKKVNVVYIILESFSAEYMGYLNQGNGYTPFLDKISTKSLIFTNAYANGRRSSQGLVALTLGFPSLMDEPFMYSAYLNNNTYGLPRLLKNKGYHTSFFNGSSKTILGWNNYIGQVGYENYFSKDKYPNKHHDDGHWGIYDHYFFNYFNEQLSTFKEPFFSTFFSISSHHPYLIPDSLKQKFNDPSDFIASLKYTDWSLGQFFKKAKKQPWFDNTIFIITADHTNGAAWKSPENNSTVSTNRIGIYKIPILIYAPKLIKPDTINDPIQQLDMFNTVLDLTEYNNEFYSFGNSVFSKKNKIAFQYVNGIYQLIKGDYILMFSEDKSIHLYNYKIDIALAKDLIHIKKNIVIRMEKELKAIVQTYQNTLIRNDMKLDL